MTDTSILENCLSINISLFRKVADSISKPVTLNSEKFISLMKKRDLRPEKDGKLFAPAIFDKSRSNENFIAASGLCLDFDHGHPNIEQVIKLFPGTLAAYYSTHRHTAELPRFRVVLPLSRPVNADEHALLVSGIKSIITPELLDCIDTTCFERARAHYLPSCPPEHKHHAFTGNQTGAPLDVEHFLTLATAAEPAIAQEIETISPAPLVYDFTDPNTGEVIDLTAWAAQSHDFDIVAAVDSQYRRGNPKDGKQHIQCPYEAEHSDTGKDLATFIVNASPPQYAAWNIHCCHAHCVDRDRLDFIISMLQKGWLSVEQLQPTAPAPLEIRRPPKIYFPVNEVSTGLEWSTLKPDEYRIALHFMTLAWTAEDGTLPDDCWMLSRRMGLNEAEWTLYRETLIRTGWLIVANGRLSNSLVKREFVNAQKAYMDAIVYGSKGGKISAAKKKHIVPPLVPPLEG